MAVLIGSARSDERGKISGGQPGDQTGKEVSTQNWYLHSKGWVVIRAKDPAVREKIAAAMEAACKNNNIGYNQANRYGLYNAVKNKGFDPAKCTVKTDTDCSALVRVCVYYAGIKCGDFNTSSELSILKGTGKFDIITDTKITNSSANLMRGDILDTRTKGHTVVVLSNGSNISNPKKKPEVALPTIKKGNKGTQCKNLQLDLNYVLGTNLVVDGKFGTKSTTVLEQFQSRYELKVDGIYGKISYAKMKQLLS